MRSAAEHLPRSGLCAVKRSEPISSFPDVADEAVRAADGAGGGQYARTAAKGKSRRWRDGDSRSDKASGAASGVVKHPIR